MTPTRQGGGPHRPRSAGRLGWAGGLAFIGVALVVAAPGFGGPPAPASVPGGATEGADELDFTLYRERIEPIFLDERGGVYGIGAACVTCHTWQTGTPLRLQPLREDPDGRVYWTEEDSRRNFLAAARLVVPGFPEQSRLLRKPLAPAAGGAESHTGGVYWTSTEDPEWQALADWVRAATARPPGAEPPDVASVDFEYFRACVQPIFAAPIAGALPCTSCHATGVRGFARPVPEGETTWDEEDSRRNFEVLMRFIEPGDPLGSRFLVHPLHPDAGGSDMHNGGRRWASTDDPEWQRLAAWVRGERTGGVCE